MEPDVELEILEGPGDYGVFCFLGFYLFIHERHRERGRDTDRGRSRLHARSPMWDLIWVSRIMPWAEGRR